MKLAAWVIAGTAVAAYAAMVFTSTPTAQAFAPVFVILTLGSWGYLTTHSERTHRDQRSRR